VHCRLWATATRVNEAVDNRNFTWQKAGTVSISNTNTVLGFRFHEYVTARRLDCCMPIKYGLSNSLVSTDLDCAVLKPKQLSHKCRQLSVTLQLNINKSRRNVSHSNLQCTFFQYPTLGLCYAGAIFWSTSQRVNDEVVLVTVPASSPAPEWNLLPRLLFPDDIMIRGVHKSTSINFLKLTYVSGARLSRFERILLFFECAQKTLREISRLCFRELMATSIYNVDRAKNFPWL